MGKFRIEITEKAQKDFKAIFKSGNQSSIKKINAMLKELETDPFKGIGNPEALKYEYSGFWSRRINAKDRLIYKVDENVVIVYIISAMGHYSDK